MLNNATYFVIKEKIKEFSKDLMCIRELAKSKSLSDQELFKLVYELQAVKENIEYLEMKADED